MDKIYFENINGYVISKLQEIDFLKDCKNTGKKAENYVEEILSENKIKYYKNYRIYLDSKKYLVPDFYLYEYDIILEVKCRGYHITGTSSEKVDNIPRKYSNLQETIYKNTKIIVVFCAKEIEIQNEILYPNREYVLDFITLSKKYNITDWIPIKSLISTITSYNKIVLKPFIKWVGGKTKLANNIIEEFPEQYNNYHELFVGGGAIFLKQKDKKIFISDVNIDLINTYKLIKENPRFLVEELKKQNYINTKEAFANNRELFNSDHIDNVTRCALFIYLNKCCFNGLYRENKLGKYNVPFGDMKNPKICDEDLILNLSKFFKNVTIDECSYEKSKNIKEMDLVYLDPPYHQTFSDYTKNVFHEKEHVKLKEFVDELTSKKVKVIISNSDTEFVRNLYSSYNIKKIDIKYSMGLCKKSSSEVIIKNF